MHLPHRNGMTPILILSALLCLACAEIMHLRSLVASKPAVENKEVIRTVQGPTRTEIRTIIKPGGERVEERIVYVESKVTDRATEHSEIPAKDQRTRYFGLGINPLDYGRPTVRAGLTVYGALDIGGTFDTRSMRPGVEAAYRF